MNRRTFLRANGSIGAGWVLAKTFPLLAETLPTSDWRNYEVVTRVELLKPQGVSHIWLPAPLIRDTPYQKTLSNRFGAERGKARLSKNKQNDLGIVSATFPADAKPALTLTSQVSLKSYSVDLSSKHATRPVSQTELSYFLQPSQYVPTDGIVKETALKITRGATTDMEKARSIYEWVVENTFRNPKIRGCVGLNRTGIKRFLDGGRR